MTIRYLFTITLLSIIGCGCREQSVSCVPPINNIPAFPGAEGFGKYAVGGRGGKILFVENLRDSGPGSFREAITQEGPRTILFLVSGTIELTTDISIKNPYVTIAGQSAPGDGICLKNGGIIINTHDVILRHVRIRPGDGTQGTPSERRDAISIIGGHSIILDHLSLGWGIDENVSIWPVNDQIPYAITLQWSIISEGLHESSHPSGPHSKGLLIGDGVKDVTIHHNLLAHNDDRNPRLKGGTKADIINNVIYNWGCCAAGVGLGLSEANDFSGVQANLVANFFKAGLNSVGSFFQPTNLQESTTPSAIYMNANMGNDSLLDAFDTDPDNFLQQYEFLTQHPPFEISINHTSADLALNVVLDKAGACRPKRDLVDQRIVNDTRKGLGQTINSQDEVGGWPHLHTIAPKRDDDQDGMPNDWEVQRGLNPNSKEDANKDDDHDGYTNIEEYLNELAGN